MMTLLRNYKKWLIVGGVAIGLGIIGWLFITQGPLAPAKVMTAKVRQDKMQPNVFGIGTVEARLSYTVGPTQAGRILKVFADQGDEVTAGQVLGEIDPVDLEQRLTALAAAVSRSESAVAVAQAQLRDLSSQNDLAQTTAARYSELYAKQAISRELMDTKYNAAAAALAKMDAGYASLLSAKDEVVRAKADYLAVQEQQRNLRLVSPVKGIVVSRDAEPGATVVAGQAVFHLVDPQTIWVKTRIDQARFHGIAVNQQAKVVLRSQPQTALTGKVARLEVQADTVTEERFVNVAFEKPNGIFPLGELAEVTIELPPVADTLVVPTAAVKRSKKQDNVWLVEGGKLKLQSVTIGFQSLDGHTQITSGLKAGDEVVVFSSKALSEGMKIRKEELP